MFAPCRVTLIEPAAAPFARRVVLIARTSIDKLDVMLPARVPTVSSTPRLAPTPCPAWLLTDVSELHVVRSHAVCNARTMAVKEARPMLAPCTVTLIPPVAAAFVRRVTLSAPSDTDKLLVTLPARAPLVTATNRLPSGLQAMLETDQENPSP